MDTRIPLPWSVVRTGCQHSAVHPLDASGRPWSPWRRRNGLSTIMTSLQVLASDGVWEVMTAQEVVHFVQRWRKRPWQGWNASDALTLEAQERWKQLQEEVHPRPALHP